MLDITEAVMGIMLIAWESTEFRQFQKGRARNSRSVNLHHLPCPFSVRYFSQNFTESNCVYLLFNQWQKNMANFPFTKV